MSEFSDLIGKTLIKIVGGKNDSDLEFYCTDGTVYNMYHSQDCCESVYVEDIIGELDDLIGVPIIGAEENNNDDLDRLPYSDESFTWTFYNIYTQKGHVTIRWYGSSKGYYSESVDFEKVQ
jgi:hypothetical protein